MSGPLPFQRRRDPYGILPAWTTADTNRNARIACENAHLASKSLSKQRLEAYLRVLEHRAGRIRRHRSVPDLFRKLKLAGASFSRPADLAKH